MLLVQDGGVPREGVGKSLDPVLGVIEDEHIVVNDQLVVSESKEQNII